MKIKNDLVSIKIGKKQYDFNNLILDSYLKSFILAQIGDEKESYLYHYRKELRYCLLKFDTSLKNLQANSELENENFDICFASSPECIQTINENQITIQYFYKTTGDALIYEYKSRRDA